jgi:hypothetical protein
MTQCGASYQSDRFFTETLNKAQREAVHWA